MTTPHHPEPGPDPDNWYEGAWDEDAENGGADYKPGREALVVTRRRFLAGLTLSGTAGFGAFVALNRGGDGSLVDQAASTTVPPTSTGPSVTTEPRVGPPVAEVPDDGLLHPAPVDQRALVLIELEGGNDGLSTVVPAGAGTYYDLRPNMSIGDEAILPIDDEVGLNPFLAQLHERQFAVVEGVGPVEGSLSHFEMVARWEQGDLLGKNGLRTGFLARLADEVDDGSGVIGLSVSGFTPRFNNVAASTLSLNDLGPLRVLTNSDWIYPDYRQAITSFAGGPMTTTIDTSYDRLVTIGNSLPGEIAEINEESPMVTEGRGLGKQLAAAAELLRSDIGVRVVHVRLGGFDTHDGHQWRHENLMTQFNAAVDGFLQLLADYGLSERVLVATSSEFGRRASENGSGFDHGAASTMLVFGPVIPGRHGEPSALGDLDKHGNLRTTVPFDSYLGTLAAWLGVEAGSVLPSEPELLTVV